jgi:sec-independent protein translocase protein TatA
MLRNALEPWHIVLLVLACTVLFGAKRLPDGARALGRSMRILRAEARGLAEDAHRPGSGHRPGGGAR